MLIKTSVRFAKVKPENKQGLKALTLGKHDIAWPLEIDKSLGLNGNKKIFNHSLAPIPLHTFSLKSIDDIHQSRLLRKHYLTLGQQGLDLIGQVFPDTMTKPIEGMELIIATSDAYNTWTTPNTSYLETSLASSKVLLEAFDVFEPYFPLLKQYETHIKVAGLLLSVANEVYMLNKEYEYKLAR